MTVVLWEIYLKSLKLLYGQRKKCSVSETLTSVMIRAIHLIDTSEQVSVEVCFLIFSRSLLRALNDYKKDFLYHILNNKNIRQWFCIWYGIK
jgi:hypothetical protein